MIDRIGFILQYTFALGRKNEYGGISSVVFIKKSRLIFYFPQWEYFPVEYNYNNNSLSDVFVPPIPKWILNA